MTALRRPPGAKVQENQTNGLGLNKQHFRHHKATHGVSRSFLLQDIEKKKKKKANTPTNTLTSAHGNFLPNSSLSPVSQWFVFELTLLRVSELR